ncbi:histidine phosphatase family protein [Planctomonas deserti]|uniref:histidine phosphatase family protein n=1 Tax=Planctomonas deserti TaxID=2144185 RepID=UPI00131F4467|nr:histidine phosphatase family protein [Planctomonas deserti]
MIDSAAPNTAAPTTAEPNPAGVPAEAPPAAPNTEAPAPPTTAAPAATAEPPTAAPSARLLLVRHGVTPWNLEGRYTSTSDVPLHESARATLEPTAVNLATRGIDRVWTSPLTRAVETAAVLRELGALDTATEATPDEDLRELDFGAFEGRSRAEMLGGPLADSYRHWMSVHDGFPAPPGGEEWTSAADRASRVLARAATAGGTTLVVSHGYLLRILVVVAVPELPVNAIRTMPLANGSVTELAYDGNGAWRLLAHNEDGVFADGGVPAQQLHS